MVKEKSESVPDDEFDKWSREIRRGAISLAILAIIHQGESYGYDIMKKLANDFPALQVEPSTTYPLLRRLEERGILHAEWSPITENKGRRLYYVTKEGRRILRKMVESWEVLSNDLQEILKEAKLIE